MKNKTNLPKDTKYNGVEKSWKFRDNSLKIGRLITLISGVLFIEVRDNPLKIGRLIKLLSEVLVMEVQGQPTKKAD